MFKKAMAKSSGLEKNTWRVMSNLFLTVGHCQASFEVSRVYAGRYGDVRVYCLPGHNSPPRITDDQQNKDEVIGYNMDISNGSFVILPYIAGL